MTKTRLIQIQLGSYYYDVQDALLKTPYVIRKEYIEIFNHVVLFVKYYPKDQVGKGGCKVKYFCHAITNRKYQCTRPKRTLRAIKKHLKKYHSD